MQTGRATRYLLVGDCDGAVITEEDLLTDLHRVCSLVNVGCYGRVSE